MAKLLGTVNMTGLEALPPVIPSPANNGGDLKLLREIVAVAAADNDGDYWVVGRLPANAVISHIRIACDAITGGTDYDLGVAYPTNKGGAVIDKDCLMDGQSFASASKSLDGFAIPAVADRYKQLWELAGLTSNPQHNLDIILTGNTVGTAAGNVSIEIHYVQK